MKVNRIFMTVWIVVIGSSTRSFSENEISAERIRLLMEANRSRYQSLETIIEMKEDRGNEIPQSNDLLIAGQRLTLRKTSNGFYAQREAIQYQDNPKKEIHLKDQAAWVCGRWKEMNSYTDPVEKIEDKSAQINSQRRVGHYRGVYEAIWGLAGYGERNWVKMGPRILAGRVSTDDGLIRLEMRANEKENGPWVLVWIDPAKEYVPVQYKVFYADKTKVYLVESMADWRRVNSVWIPMSFTRYIAPLNARQEYRVESIKVNEIIALERMDFDFPEGTTIDDRILNVRYKAQNSQVGGGTGIDPGSLSPGIMSTPLSDQQLAGAALQAGNLALQNQKNTLTTAEEALFMQEYVWVLPGKNQYTLELAPETKTRPALSGNSISDSPLILQGVDDQLAASGKLIVTLERPEGHKVFADAVLTLDFAGTKVPIHFVAAPLP